MDWRFGHEWKSGYFRNHDFYEKRNTPYDAKYPWELARLSFVPLLIQGAALDRDRRTEWIDQATRIVTDWERSNPLAHSIGWYPMEVAMRTISLTFALEMCLAMGEDRAETLSPLLRLLTTHGIFLFRNVEYTDVRGNHYAADIAALLLIGLVLGEHYPEAASWVSYAQATIPHEIESQFLPDGVNFEKSVSYHRLVTELFLVSLVALERSGFMLASETRERLHHACRYTAAYVRPDGLSPNVGDNDDARVLNFDLLPLRDHRNLALLAASFFRDPDLIVSPVSMASLAWLLGQEGVDWATRHSGMSSTRDVAAAFLDGGVVVVRRSENYLWMDVGEVGLSGRGGHGHNDLLSFEVLLDGFPLVVDPGSYMYTATPEWRDRFRSTAYHNGLRIDFTEIAPLSGMWRIGNDAQPTAVRVHIHPHEVYVEAGHTGYERLLPPVKHLRRLTFDMDASRLTCVDNVRGSGAHVAERFLHFDPRLEVQADKELMILSCDGRRWVVRWNEPSTVARIEKQWVSAGYGVKEEAAVLILTSEFVESADLQFVIEPWAGGSQ